VVNLKVESVNLVHHAEEVFFHVFPETTVFFQGLFTKRADVFADVDAAKTLFGVSIVAVVGRLGITA
jgi:hypothetical protein